MLSAELMGGKSPQKQYQPFLPSFSPAMQQANTGKSAFEFFSFVALFRFIWPIPPRKDTISQQNSGGEDIFSSY